MKTPTSAPPEVPKESTRQKAARLSRFLSMPPGELIHVVTLAGLLALETTIERRGKITLPLALETTGDKAPLIAQKGSEPETIAVHLPAAIVRKLNAMFQCIGIQDGAAVYLTDLMQEDLADDSTHTADLIIDLWNVAEPETVAAILRIQQGATATLLQGGQP